jgi:hypothetical protein
LAKDEMNIRIQADDLPETVFESIGAILNKGLLRVQDVAHRPTEQLVTFPLQRFPIVGKSVLTGSRHSETPVACTVAIRNVSHFKIEDSKKCQTITILFGLGRKGDELFITSAEEDRGQTCFTMTCTVSKLDMEIKDS